MVYMNPLDMQKLNINASDSLLINETVVHVLCSDDDLEEGFLASSALLWKALLLENSKAIGTVVRVESWSNSKINRNIRAKMIVIVVDTYAKQVTEIKAEALEIHIQNSMSSQVFCKDQRWIMKWVQNGRDFWLNLRIANIHYIPDDQQQIDSDVEIDDTYDTNNNRATEPTKWGVLLSNYTSVTLMAARNPMMKLIQPQGMANGMTALDWDAEKLGIGGLDAQFAIIFRRAFASRMYPPEILRQLGVKHIKGMHNTSLKQNTS